MLGNLGQAVAILHTSTKFPTSSLLATIDSFFTRAETKV
jgi:hypothetical protein